MLFLIIKWLMFCFSLFTKCVFLLLTLTRVKFWVLYPPLIAKVFIPLKLSHILCPDNVFSWGFICSTCAKYWITIRRKKLVVFNVLFEITKLTSVTCICIQPSSLQNILCIHLYMEVAEFISEGQMFCEVHRCLLENIREQIASWGSKNAAGISEDI